MMVKLLEEAIEPTMDMLIELAGQGECVVVCYNQAEVWKSRKEATDFYLEAMYACEGCERERYTNVMLDLMANRAVAYDGVTKLLTRETEYR